MFILIGSNLLVLSVPLVLYLRTGKKWSLPNSYAKGFRKYTHEASIVFSMLSKIQLLIPNQHLNPQVSQLSLSSLCILCSDIYLGFL